MIKDRLNDGLTLRLFQSVYHCYPMWGLRCCVNHLRLVVNELVCFYHSHLGPVREIDIVLEQTDAKWVWDHSTSVSNSFSVRPMFMRISNSKSILCKSYRL